MSDTAMQWNPAVDSSQGNPTMKTLLAVLEGVGLKLGIYRAI
ncbi:UNVERIFIED_ORG: hypothetical protein JN05_04862 [Zoogloea ramigera]